MKIIAQKGLNSFEFKSLLTSKSNLKNIEKIIYAPKQLAKGLMDKVELSTKTKTIHPKFVPINLDVEKLKKMGEQRLTLRELAEEFDVSISTIRTHLKKHNVISPEREECAVMKKYYSASNEKEKTQAFTEIDKILIPIAKEKYKPSYGITFEDFLQDLRLKFVEFAKKRHNGNRSIPYNTFEIIRGLELEKSPVLKKSNIELSTVKVAEDDIATINFEELDFLNCSIKKAYLKYREHDIFEDWFDKKMSFNSIGDNYGLTHQTIRLILQNVLEKIQEQQEILSDESTINAQVSSGFEYIQKKLCNELGVKYKEDDFKIRYFMRADKYNVEQLSRALMKAIHRNDIESLKRILQIKIKNEDFLNITCQHELPLSTAIRQNWEAGLKLLLVRPDIDVNIQGHLGNTPLSAAILYYNEDIVKLLIKHPNIDVNKGNNIGITPLHNAIYQKMSNTVKLLLQHPNIDVNKADYRKNTPLMLALLNSREDLADLLINHPNIDLSLKNSKGETALQIAKDKKLTKSIELIEKRLLQ